MTEVVINLLSTTVQANTGQVNLYTGNIGRGDINFLYFFIFIFLFFEFLNSV